MSTHVEQKPGLASAATVQSVMVIQLRTGVVILTRYAALWGKEDGRDKVAMAERGRLWRMRLSVLVIIWSSHRGVSVDRQFIEMRICTQDNGQSSG